MKRYRLKYGPNISANKTLAARRLERRGRTNFLISLSLIIILGYFSLTWFLPTLIGGLSVINKFKDDNKPQTPVSADVTLAPPVLNIPFEATNTATITVKGYSLPETEVEIYVDDKNEGTTTTKEDGSFEVKVDLSLGNNTIFGKTVDNRDKKSLPSKPILVFYQNEKPQLDINEPGDNQTINGGDKRVNVSGTVKPSNGITVTANGIRFIVSSDGKFFQAIPVNEGDNTVTVVAVDQAGNTTQVERKVIYQP